MSSLDAYVEATRPSQKVRLRGNREITIHGLRSGSCRLQPLPQSGSVATCELVSERLGQEDKRGPGTWIDRPPQRSVAILRPEGGARESQAVRARREVQTIRYLVLHDQICWSLSVDRVLEQRALGRLAAERLSAINVSHASQKYLLTTTAARSRKRALLCTSCGEPVEGHGGQNEDQEANRCNEGLRVISRCRASHICCSNTSW